MKFCAPGLKEKRMQRLRLMHLGKTGVIATYGFGTFGVIYAVSTADYAVLGSIIVLGTILAYVSGALYYLWSIFVQVCGRIVHFALAKELVYNSVLLIGSVGLIGLVASYNLRLQDGLDESSRVVIGDRREPTIPHRTRERITWDLLAKGGDDANDHRSVPQSTTPLDERKTTSGSNGSSEVQDRVTDAQTGEYVGTDSNEASISETAPNDTGDRRDAGETRPPSVRPPPSGSRNSPAGILYDPRNFADRRYKENPLK